MPTLIHLIYSSADANARTKVISTAAALGLVLTLAACGGGGGGGVSASVSEGGAIAPTMSTAMSAFRTKGAMPENFRPIAILPAAAIASAAGQLTPSAGATYLKVWTLDPASGQQSVLSLGKWTPGQALPGIQTLQAASTAYFELYNDVSSVAGSWSLL